VPPVVSAEDQIARLTEETRRLRHEVVTSRAASARALSRATRLAQLVSAIGQLTDPKAIFDRAATEVAEQYGADIAVFLTPSGSSPGELVVATHWGIAPKHVPAEVGDLPATVRRLTTALPVVAGPVDEVGAPDWLRVGRPRHIAWGQLTARAELLGYLLLARREDRAFELTDVQELCIVVGRVAMAVDNGRLYSRTQEQLRRLQRLHDMTTVLAGSLDLDRVVTSIARTMVNEVPVSGAAVYLAASDGLTLVGHAGEAGDVPATMTTGGVGDRPDAEVLPLGTGGPTLGALLVTGGPRPGSEANAFLHHLADLGSLVIEKSLLFQRVRNQAEYDTLTGLPNRALFMERLGRALERAEPTGSEVAVIFVDLDGFKAVNDTHGHEAGDRLLVAVAGRLTGAMRPSDLVARLGGDEFVVLCEDLPGPEAAAAVAQRIRAAMCPPIPLGEVEVTALGSMGAALASTSGYDSAALLRDADAAMYVNKQRSRAVRAA
jgi:diguanylate cyclase (GGDEF)-like protein